MGNNYEVRTNMQIIKGNSDTQSHPLAGKNPLLFRPAGSDLNEPFDNKGRDEFWRGFRLIKDAIVFATLLRIHGGIAEVFRCRDGKKTDFTPSIKFQYHSVQEVVNLLRAGNVLFDDEESRQRMAKCLEELIASRAAIYNARVAFASIDKLT